jgi:aspartyl-tRNA(Asn)/glutamyl-tRNA(Gln) amidotransferase subunit B
LFDPVKGETRSMRNKEEAHDYRYFPDPDLLPLELTPALVDDLRKQLPELPDEKKTRFTRDYGLSAYDAGVLVAERETADFFETVARGRDAKAAANWVINELAGRLNREGSDIAASPLSAQQLGAILDLIAAGTISGKIAKDLFEIAWNEGGDPHAIVAARGMKQVTDLSAIEKVVDDIVAENPDKVAQAKAKPALVGWFVGQVMKASGGKANPQAVNELLKRKLGLGRSGETFEHRCRHCNGHRHRCAMTAFEPRGSSVSCMVRVTGADSSGRIDRYGAARNSK